MQSLWLGTSRGEPSTGLGTPKVLLQPRVDPYSVLTTRWTRGITVALLPPQDHYMMPILQVKAGRDREVQELPPSSHIRERA